MDECWLDVTGSQGLFGDGRTIAEKIRQQVKEELGITVSIGVSFNKVFAKLGSDMKKPDAVTVLDRENWKERIWPLPVTELLFVGRSTGRKLQDRGVCTIGELAQVPPEYVRSWLGKNGLILWCYANGEDISRVMPDGYEAPVKSVGHGITCSCDLRESRDVWRVILELAQDVGRRLRLHGMAANGVRLGMRSSDLCGCQCASILAELEQKINSGEIPLRFDRKNSYLKRMAACPGSGSILSISFRRFPGNEVCAKIFMTAKVRRTYSHNGVEDEEGQPLSEYLIPYFSREDIEQEAERILFSLCPEALRKPELINAGNLIRLLGLVVIRLPLYKREKTQSVLFFADGETLVDGDDGKVRKVHVAADTIVLNANYPKVGYEKDAIFHECFHYVEHQLFFKLQKAANSDVGGLPDWEPKEGQKANENPIKWMEWQARFGSQCLQMPRSMVRQFTDQALREMRGVSVHDGAKLEWIGKKLASRFNVYNYRARNRLIQTGYLAARGALNYVNCGYVQPFAFSAGECRSGQTFVISIDDALREYVRNEAFRRLLDSGRYVYVDGHFCLNDARYVRQHEWRGQKRLYLTDWANAHVDQCCLRFVIQYTRDRQSKYNFGQLNSDDEYNERILTLSLSEESGAIMKRALAILNALRQLPRSFPDTLREHMKTRKMTVERLEEESQLSVRTIMRLRTEERSEYSLDQVIAICIALHLPPEFSFDLLQKAGLTLRDTPQHLIYRAVLRTMYMESVPTVQAKLRECQCPQLRLKDISA